MSILFVVGLLSPLQSFANTCARAFYLELPARDSARVREEATRWHANSIEYSKYEGSVEFSPAILRRAWRSNDFFRTQELYDAIGRDRTRIERLATVWYNDQAPISRYREVLPDHLAPIILDPGIAQHHEAFLEFVPNFLASHPHSDILQLRNAFSQSLGTKRVYRALSLTEAEVASIRTNGLLPRSKSFQPYHDETYNYAHIPDYPNTRLATEIWSWSSFLHKGPYGEMYNRATMGGENNFTQSVTDFPAIGVAVTRAFGQGGRRTYVFELDVPVLEVIPGERIGRQLKDTPIETSEGVYRLDQPGVESFILGEIKSEWISGVREIDD